MSQTKPSHTDSGIRVLIGQRNLHKPEAQAAVVAITAAKAKANA